MNEELLTVHEVATRLRVKDYTVRDWLRTGRLPGIKPGGRGWRVRADDLARRLKPQPNANHLKKALETLEELKPVITKGYLAPFNVVEEMEAMREERDKEIAGE